jgi:hypothetical protein
MLFLKGRTMKTRKNLSHSHEISEAGTVSAYDGWRENVSITIRDESDNGTDEVSIDLPNSVFEKLAKSVNKIVDERAAAIVSELEESEVE